MGFSARPSSVLSLVCKTLLLPLPNPLRFGKGRVKRLALQGLGGGGSFALYCGSRGRAGRVGRSWRPKVEEKVWECFEEKGRTDPEACSPGVLFFLRAFARARACSHPFGLAVADRRWRDSVPHGGQKTSREKPCPGSVRKPRPLSSRAAAAREPGDSHHLSSPARLPPARVRRADRAAV